jgi:hypothetical protein
MPEYKHDPDELKKTRVVWDAPEKKTQRSSVLEKSISQRKAAKERDDGISCRRFVTDLQNFVRAKQFDYLVGVFLAANAITIGIQADRHAGEAVPGASTDITPLFSAINIVFCMIFTLEVGARLLANGANYLSIYSGSWKSRWFDVMVVLFTIFDELSQAFLQGTAVKRQIDSFGFLRMLRLSRLARILKMVTFIPELKSTVNLILASMSFFLWNCVLITFFIYVFAVYFTELSTSIVVASAVSVDNSEMQSHWGSILQSVLTLFSAITGGDDWRNYVEVFKDGDPWFELNSLAFSIYIAFAILVMLNLVTGVFVEGAQRIAKMDRHDASLACAANMFAGADLDCTAELSKAEFDELLEDPHMNEFLRAQGVQREDADKLVRVFDEDNSGELGLLEFVGGCIKLDDEAKSADLIMLRYNQIEMMKVIADLHSKMDQLVRDHLS